MQRGVVIVESIAPNDHFEGGEGINTLTSSYQARPTAARRSTTTTCGYGKRRRKMDGCAARLLCGALMGAMRLTPP